MSEMLRRNLSHLAEQARSADDLYGQVVRGSKRLQRRNRLVGAGAVAAMAIAVLAVNLSGKDLAPDPAATPMPTSSIGPSPVHAEVLDWAVYAPDFPGLARECPAQVWQFRGGVADRPAGAPRLRQVGMPRVVEIDGDGEPEVLIPVSCGVEVSQATQILAVGLREAGGGQTTAFVMQSPDHTGFYFDPTWMWVENRRVSVIVGAPGCPGSCVVLDRQTRTYEWAGSGQFRQVGGPTSFPPLTADVHRVDFHNSTFSVDSFFPGAYVRFTGGVDTVRLPEDFGTGTIDTLLKVAYVSTGGADAAVLFIRRTSLDGDVYGNYVVVVEGRPDGVPFGRVLARARVSGMEQVLDVSVSGDTITVKVIMDSQGLKDLIYRKSTDDSGYWGPWPS